MAGNWISPAEKQMYDTFEHVLALPLDERIAMEEAENFPFTQTACAETLDLGRRSRSAMQLGGDNPACDSTYSVVIDMGTVEAAVKMVDKGLRPAVLNFAHGYNCGGGFEHAGGSQEEDIFRKTSLVLSLWPHRRTDDGPGVLARGMWIGDFDDKLARKEPFYPHSECAVIYSPHVRAVRNLNLRGHPLRTEEAHTDLPLFSVLTCAAQDCGRDPPFRDDLLREKCRSVLWVASLRGHDSVVLGAFGCGYFHNPPEVVAKTWCELLQGEFAGMFTHVVFAIPGAYSRNYESFADVFPVREARDENWLTPPTS